MQHHSKFVYCYLFACFTLARVVLDFFQLQLMFLSVDICNAADFCAVIKDPRSQSFICSVGICRLALHCLYFSTTFQLPELVANIKTCCSFIRAASGPFAFGKYSSATLTNQISPRIRPLTEHAQYKNPPRAYLLQEDNLVVLCLRPKCFG